MAANEVVFIVRALRSAVKGGATMLLGMSPRCVALVPAAVHSIFDDGGRVVGVGGG